MALSATNSIEASMAPKIPPRVYIETSIVSYLTARSTRDLIAAARQELTRTWWGVRRGEFDLVSSQLVLREAGRGDPEAAALRLQALAGVRLLDITDRAIQLAESIIAAALVPAAAADDALHVAIAVDQGVEFLLTWNCRHIANATIWKALSEHCATRGLAVPNICTPDMLIGE